MHSLGSNECADGPAGISSSAATCPTSPTTPTSPMSPTSPTSPTSSCERAGGGRSFAADDVIKRTDLWLTENLPQLAATPALAGTLSGQRCSARADQACVFSERMVSRALQDVVADVVRVAVREARKQTQRVVNEELMQLMPATFEAMVQDGKAAHLEELRFPKGTRMSVGDLFSSVDKVVKEVLFRGYSHAEITLSHYAVISAITSALETELRGRLGDLVMTTVASIKDDLLRSIQSMPSSLDPETAQVLRRCGNAAANNALWAVVESDGTPSLEAKHSASDSSPGNACTDAALNSASHSSPGHACADAALNSASHSSPGHACSGAALNSASHSSPGHACSEAALNSARYSPLQDSATLPWDSVSQSPGHEMYDGDDDDDDDDDGVDDVGRTAPREVCDVVDSTVAACNATPHRAGLAADQEAGGATDGASGGAADGASGGASGGATDGASGGASGGAADVASPSAAPAAAFVSAVCETKRVTRSSSKRLDSRTRLDGSSEDPQLEQQQPPPLSLSDLPDEVLVRVFTLLGPKERVLLVADVCRRWRDLCQRLWQYETLRYEPRNAQTKEYFCRVLQLANEIAVVDCEPLTRSRIIPANVSHALLSTACRVRGLVIKAEGLPENFVLQLLRKHAEHLETLDLTATAGLCMRPLPVSSPSGAQGRRALLATVDSMVNLKQLKFAGNFVQFVHEFAPRLGGDLAAAMPDSGLVDVDLGELHAANDDSTASISSLILAHRATLRSVRPPKKVDAEVMDALQMLPNLQRLDVSCDALLDHPVHRFTELLKITLRPGRQRKASELPPPSDSPAVLNAMPCLRVLVLHGMRTLDNKIPNSVLVRFDQLWSLTLRETRLGDVAYVGLVVSLPALRRLCLYHVRDVTIGLLSELAAARPDLTDIELKIKCDKEICWELADIFLHTLWYQATITATVECQCKCSTGST